MDDWTKVLRKYMRFWCPAEVNVNKIPEKFVVEPRPAKYPYPLSDRNREIECELPDCSSPLSLSEHLIDAHPGYKTRFSGMRFGRENEHCELICYWPSVSRVLNQLPKHIKFRHKKHYQNL